MEVIIVLYRSAILIKVVRVSYRGALLMEVVSVLYRSVLLMEVVRVFIEVHCGWRWSDYYTEVHS